MRKKAELATAQRGDRACDAGRRESAPASLVIRKNGSPATPPASLTSDVDLAKTFHPLTLRFAKLASAHDRDCHSRHQATPLEAFGC